MTGSLLLAYPGLMYGLVALTAQIAEVFTTTTTPAGSTQSSVVTTTAATTQAPAGRSFDGVSFIGGIIFACCCIVGGLVLYKYCSKKKNPGDNYGVF